MGNGLGSMRINTDIKLDFQDVLLQPKRSTIVSRKDINLTRNFKFLYASKARWTGIPIISSNMSSVTTVAVAKKLAEHHMLACIPKHFTNSLQSEVKSIDNCIPSIGLHGSIYEGFKFLFLCLDVPNGYIEKVIDRVKKIREILKDSRAVIVGNVVTPEMTEALILAGADIVKIGIGSGSACSTRIKTGVGYPQLSAIIECADAAHGLGGHIISDGGCSTPGDIVKAFAAGADFVMIGGMLAGHEENGTEFYGMSSETANNKFAGGLKDYRAAEGLEFNLPNRGPIEKTLQDIEGGLRSACAYVGAKTLKDLPKCATFIRVNRLVNQSLWEYKIK
jgi:GMP reductase